MKRRKPPIDNQGHTPRPGGAQAIEECSTCHDVHVKGRDWRRPCSREESTVEPVGLHEWTDRHEARSTG